MKKSLREDYLINTTACGYFQPENKDLPQVRADGVKLASDWGFPYYDPRFTQMGGGLELK
jgi:hypothetical protein